MSGQTKFFLIFLLLVVLACPVTAYTQLASWTTTGTTYGDIRSYYPTICLNNPQQIKNDGVSLVTFRGGTAYWYAGTSTEGTTNSTFGPSSAYSVTVHYKKTGGLFGYYNNTYEIEFSNLSITGSPGTSGGCYPFDNHNVFGTFGVGGTQYMGDNTTLITHSNAPADAIVFGNNANGAGGNFFFFVEGTTTVYSGTAAVYLNPEFSANKTSGMVPLAVNFFDQTMNASTMITDYSWSFGDGSTGSGVSPVHVYNVSGIYNVTETVTYTGGIVNSTTKNNYIQAFPYGSLQANYWTVQDSVTQSLITDAYVSLYDVENTTWYNETSSTGIVNHTFPIGRHVGYQASKSGYNTSQYQVVAISGSNSYPIFLSQLVGYYPNILGYTRVPGQVVNASDGHPVLAGVEFYNLSLDYKTSTDANGNFMLYIKNGGDNTSVYYYTALATADGYYTGMKNVTITGDSISSVNFFLQPKVIPVQTTIPTLTPLPTVNVTQFPTVTGTIPINGSFNVSLPVPSFSINLPPSMPALPYYLNSTYIRTDLITKFPIVIGLLDIIDGICGFMFYGIDFFLNVVILPTTYVFGANGSVSSIITMYLLSWAPMAAPIVWVIGVCAAMLGPKIQACIIITMCFQIILQIRDTLVKGT